ncbi:hypothetical protein EYF80_019316 [Liparis tanakae]|uniref:Uncharacterized protein n=1 Tax=Liparis tanakae TaxID=230148 RepID=A0A4Z2HX76_9TELE|nr:hypothetical protein EYF80_019316 [Liparis tanakae]
MPDQTDTGQIGLSAREGKRDGWIEKGWEDVTREEMDGNVYISVYILLAALTGSTPRGKWILFDVHFEQKGVMVGGRGSMTAGPGFDDRLLPPDGAHGSALLGGSRILRETVAMGTFDLRCLIKVRSSCCYAQLHPHISTQSSQIHQLHYIIIIIIIVNIIIIIITSLGSILLLIGADNYKSPCRVQAPKTLRLHHYTRERLGYFVICVDGWSPSRLVERCDGGAWLVSHGRTRLLLNAALRIHKATLRIQLSER